MVKYFIIFALIAQSQCTIVIDHIAVNCNEKYTNLSVKVINGNAINVRLEAFKAIRKMNIQVKVNVPLNKDDQGFQKEAFKTSIDYERLLKGVQGNFIIQVIMENFFKSIDFRPQLPMIPGIYTITNWTIEDSKIPIFMNTKLTFEGRTIGKVEGVKASVHLFTFKAFAEIDKSFQ